MCPASVYWFARADRSATSCRTVEQEKEATMNWDQIQGKWKQAKGQVKQKWGELTDDELDAIDGKREQLVGRVQERYGLAKEEAEQQVSEFQESCRC
jgi:uncharacterized protein YjbJ (UPF0337 family)